MFLYHGPTTKSGFSGWRPAGIGKELRTARPVDGCARENTKGGLAHGHGLGDSARGTVSRESSACGARCFVVAVMRVRPALLGVCDRARLVACECEISAEQSHLTDDNKQPRQKTQARHRRPSHAKGVIHLDLSYPARRKTVALGYRPWHFSMFHEA